jgi:hypothetical protein
MGRQQCDPSPPPTIGWIEEIAGATILRLGSSSPCHYRPVQVRVGAFALASVAGDPLGGLAIGEHKPRSESDDLRRVFLIERRGVCLKRWRGHDAGHRDSAAGGHIWPNHPCRVDHAVEFLLSDKA